MTFLTDRLVEMRRHLVHLYEVRRRVPDAQTLLADMSLHNDVMFSLWYVSQSVIDIAGELAGRRGLRFQDYGEAVRSLAKMQEFPRALVDRLVGVAGFRNVVIHEYLALDYHRVVLALNDLSAIEEFGHIVEKLEEQTGV